MSGLTDSAIVDDPLTAGDLGRINYNSSVATKLSKDYCKDSPGKVAYAMFYYHNILGNPPMIPLTCP